MRDIILALDRFGDQALLLGRVGENRATQILIDLKSILSQYPDAIASITVKQPGRAEYPAAVKQEGGILTWEITSADIGDKAGSGQAQITIQDADGTVIKTAIVCTRVSESLGDATAPAPDPVETWLDKATGTLDDVKRAGNAAQAVADEVQRRLDNGDFVGPQGPQGDKGETGPIGPQGTKGEKGDKGDRGEKGDTGPQGETGAKGDAFTFGDFTPEQLESLRGPKGDTGATGPQGVKGEKGDKGDTGAKGDPGKDAVIDATLTQAGQAADAKKVGDEFETVREGLDNKAEKARQNILIGTETGTTVSAADAFAAPLCGLTIYGRSTQDSTPTPDAPVPIVSAGNGGTISVTIGDGADERQTITLQTPNGLPGIPVKSGGNYTDENGQQWICDEIDLTRGVRVQRVGSYTLKNITMHGFDNLANNYRIMNATEIEKKASGTVYSLLCTDYENNQVDQWAWPEKNNRISWSGDPYRQLRVYDERDQAEIIESLNSGNVRVDYVLGDPVETPLTDAEIAAYKALAVYAPAIAAEVADGAGIRLSYQKDVNLVIKNLEDAIASMTNN